MGIEKSVLFICKHNSARSQMAEGLLKELYGAYYDVYSAGSNPDIVDPYAVKVMANRGIDISMNRSKSLNEFRVKNLITSSLYVMGKMKDAPFSQEVKFISINHSKTHLWLN